MDKIESELEEVGYRIIQKNETSILFDSNANGFEIVSRVFFLDKARKGKIEFNKKQREAVIFFSFFISIEPLLMLTLMLILGAVVVSHKVFFLVPVVVAIYLHCISIIKRTIQGMLNKCSV